MQQPGPTTSRSGPSWRRTSPSLAESWVGGIWGVHGKAVVGKEGAAGRQQLGRAAGGHRTCWVHELVAVQPANAGAPKWEPTTFHCFCSVTLPLLDDGGSPRQTAQPCHKGLGLGSPGSSWDWGLQAAAYLHRARNWSRLWRGLSWPKGGLSAAAPWGARGTGWVDVTSPVTPHDPLRAELTGADCPVRSPRGEMVHADLMYGSGVEAVHSMVQ